MTLLALLKHPLLRLGAGETRIPTLLARWNWRCFAAATEARHRRLVHALKNFRAQRGTLYRSDPRKQLWDAELDLADELARRLAAALAPLESLPRATASFPEIAICHRKAVEELSAGNDGKAAAFAGAGNWLRSPWPSMRSLNTLRWHPSA